MYNIDVLVFFFQAEDGIRDRDVTGVQTCALPISVDPAGAPITPGVDLPAGQPRLDAGPVDDRLVGRGALGVGLAVLVREDQLRRRADHDPDRRADLAGVDQPTVDGVRADQPWPPAREVDQEQRWSGQPLLNRPVLGRPAAPTLVGLDEYQRALAGPRVPVRSPSGPGSAAGRSRPGRPAGKAPSCCALR